MTVERGFCCDFYFYGEIRGELRTNVIKNLAAEVEIKNREE